MNVVIFGGTGGLGSGVYEFLAKDSNYTIFPVGSSQVDVTNFEAVSDFFSKNEFEVVINLSGINFDTFAHKISSENYQKVEKQIDVNIKGTINIISSCLPKMRENNFGRIITASSVLAERPVISTSVYSGCKGFIDSFTKTVALENAGKNITCNSIQLGYFDRGLTWKIPDEFRKILVEQIPTKRLGTVGELVNTIKYLIETQYINGINLKVNGGIDF
jgi:NAD(P)-dependent dehydrogenase (short-subunit alcohol dehydrogenase family)